MNSRSEAMVLEAPSRHSDHSLQSTALESFVSKVSTLEQEPEAHVFGRLGNCIEPGEAIAAKVCLEQLFSVLQEVYQDHLLYDYFRSQDTGEDAESLESICSKVSELLAVLQPLKQVR